jgi:hypothetical protein
MEDARAKTAVSSSQENAFMVLAAEALADKSRTIALSVDGVPQQGAFFKSWRAALANKTAPHDTKWAENPHSAPHVGDAERRSSFKLVLPSRFVFNSGFEC